MADTYEKDLTQKSSLTTSDYIRVVGSDNVSYKQDVNSVKSGMGVTTLENRFRYVSSGSFNDLQTYGLYMCQSLTEAPSTTWSQYCLIVIGSSTTTKQIAFPTTSDNYIFIRRYASNTWSAWATHQLP